VPGECKLPFILPCRDVLITDTRNRFRWAVCQIDALQRLKCERDVVKKALANLPKTLDETYDRIFLTIPEGEHPFVHHALQWIYYHNELYQGEGIPCAVLLQGVGKSTAELTANQNERFYDNETLRELCGCLINITPENLRDALGKTRPVFVVSFAHYTVREYLDSTRIPKNSTVYLAACKENLKQNFMEITFSEAHHIEQNELWKGGTASNNSCDVVDAIEGNFNVYCVVSALLSLRKWPREISQQDTLCTLAIDLLDPSKPHFQILNTAAQHIEASTSLFSDRDWFYECQFWNVMWDPYPNDTGAVHLLNLLLLTRHSSERLAFAKKFLQGKDTKDFLQTRLTFTMDVWFVVSDHDMENYIFDGSIIEVFAQLSLQWVDIFELLLEYGTGLFDPSRVLPLFIGRHYFDPKDKCYGYCPTERLLELGADPNMMEYQVTPLQIAVVSWDFESVSTLLKAGADPNGTGNSDGVFWEKGTLMSRFNHLHNASPLYIFRNFECFFEGYTKENREGDEEEIEEILLQYGAEAFLRS
jgi:hypothetical protein